jgi:DEAD/DEAH box helicase domain-containing protein
VELTDFVHALKNDLDFGQALVHHRSIPPQEAAYEEDEDLPAEIAGILPHLGIRRLFKHQVDAIKNIRQGANVLVATPTASGKSLIYNLSFLERLLRNPSAKALYVFPLKALEQDQMKNLLFLLKGLKGKTISAGVYDGDTSPYRRKQIRANIPQILVTNPDMLHSDSGLP